MGMAEKRTQVQPGDADVVKKARELGTKIATAAFFGYSESGFKDFLNRNPILKSKVEEAIAAHKIEHRKAKAHVKGPEEEVSREEVLDAEVSRLEKLVQEHRRAQVFDERVISGFEAAYGKVDTKYNPRVVRPRSRSDESKHEHVLLFSDSHANEVVSLEETMGLNAFDWNIMLRRMARIQKSVLSFQEHKDYPIKKLHIHMLGDNFSGDIHAELTETNEMAHEASVVQYSLDTTEWLKGFTDHYPEIVVRGVPGNHPRRTQKPTAKYAFNNSDWTFYQFLQARLGHNDQFDFDFKKAKFMEAVVAERWNTLLLHGDGPRSSMIDVPWGGIIRYLGKLARQFAAAGRPIDIFELGHYHQANAIEAGGPGVNTFINGTIKGVDEYSLQRFGGGGPPKQLLLTVHPKRGVTDVSYLDCEDVVPQHERFIAAA